MNTFRYQLSGLQRVQTYQIDQLVMELSSLKEKAARQHELLHDLDNQIAEQEERLTQHFKEQPLFWIEARELAVPYIAGLRIERDRQYAELERLTADIDRVMADIVEARKSRLLLDKHRRRCLDIHIRHGERDHRQTIDELALKQATRSVKALR